MREGGGRQRRRKRDRKEEVGERAGEGRERGGGELAAEDFSLSFPDSWTSALGWLSCLSLVPTHINIHFELN